MDGILVYRRDSGVISSWKYRIEMCKSFAIYVKNRFYSSPHFKRKYVVMSVVEK